MRGAWADYWRRVCAPKLKQRKEELGRSAPEAEIAVEVEAASGKRTGRSALNLMLLGKREPYISQFLALCQQLGKDPIEVLRDRSLQAAPPLRRIDEQVVRKNARNLIRTKTGNR